MGSLNKYSKRDYINNVKWQNKDHDKFERILELYNYDRHLESKHKSTANKQKNDIINNIIAIIRRYNNSFDFDIPIKIFKVLYTDKNKIEWQLYNTNYAHWYTLEKNKKDKWQIWIKSEQRLDNNTMYFHNGLMYIDYNYNGYSEYDRIFKHTTLLTRLEDLKICYNQLAKLNKYSIMEYSIDIIEDLYS